MSDIVKRLRDEADHTDKNWYRVASEEQREFCRALTLEAADYIRALETRLEVYDASGQHYLGIGSADGIGCRNETIRLLDARIATLQSAPTLETTSKHGSMDHGGIGDVGCERPDGTLNIHRVQDTCEVCASTENRGTVK